MFAGASAPLSAAMSALGLARLEPLDKLHGCHFNLLDDSQYRELCSLASSGAVGAASAALPCAPYSRARLRPGGPAPVRTPLHPTGIPSPTTAQQTELSESAELHARARHFLALVAAHGGLIILENPASSLLWLDPSVRAWLAVHAPFCAHIAACQFGLPLPKAWAFWSNFDLLSALGCRCPHPPRFHPSFAGKRNSDGSFATRQTACYPQPLAEAIAKCIQHFMSLLDEPVLFASWRDLLPASFIWPVSSVASRTGLALAALHFGACRVSVTSFAPFVLCGLPDCKPQAYFLAFSPTWFPQAKTCLCPTACCPYLSMISGLSFRLNRTMSGLS